MNSSGNEHDQKRMDAALRAALSGIEPPALSGRFAITLEQRLVREARSSRQQSAQRAMRAYWILTGLASLVILYLLGSPSPMITWTVVGSLVVAVLLSATPQLLFNRPRRSSLLDLILDSVR